MSFRAVNNEPARAIAAAIGIDESRIYELSLRSCADEGETVTVTYYVDDVLTGLPIAVTRKWQPVSEAEIA